MSTSIQIVRESDRYDLIAALWIIACNDENPIITYQGLGHRFGFDADGVEKARKWVAQHPELFRRGIAEWRLEKWKNRMRSADRPLPRWIAEKIQVEQINAINNLSAADIFTSQFRTSESAPASIATIEWGLQHIERRRKAEVEANTQAWAKWQVIVTMIGVALTFLAAAISVYAAVYTALYK